MKRIRYGKIYTHRFVYCLLHVVVSSTKSPLHNFISARSSSALALTSRATPAQAPVPVPGPVPASTLLTILFGSTLVPCAAMWKTKTATEYATEVREEGYTILREFIAVEDIDNMAESFTPILQKRMSSAPPDRGPGRYYTTVPFTMPFANPAIFGNQFLSDILEGIVGKDFVMCQLACDTPVAGSEYQEIHRDTEGLFLDETSDYVETPAYQLGVNFPLCDITSHDIGPLEIAKNTHMMTSHNQDKLIKSQSVELDALYMKKGDILIRDVRCLHRGTPNITDKARAMVVMGYSRKWLRRPEVGLTIPQSFYDNLNVKTRHMLRFEPIVPDDDKSLQYNGLEKYDASTLSNASGNSIKL